MRETSDLVEMRVLKQTNLGREVLDGSSFNRVDREFVVGVNGSETSRNLIRRVKNGISRRQKRCLLTKPLLRGVSGLNNFNNSRPQGFN